MASKKRSDYTFLTHKQLADRWGMSEMSLSWTVDAENIPRFIDFHGKLVDVNTIGMDWALEWLQVWPIPRDMCLFRLPDVKAVEKRVPDLKRQEGQVQELPKDYKEYAWLTFDELTERWRTNEVGIRDIVRRLSLQRYVVIENHFMTVEERESARNYWSAVQPKRWVFKLVDVEKLENDIPGLRQKKEAGSIPQVPSEDGNGMDAKERQELGMLRQHKAKWGRCIPGAIHAALISRGLEASGDKMTRDRLADELADFDLPETFVREIWKALRDKNLTKVAGRPKKK